MTGGAERDQTANGAVAAGMCGAGRVVVVVREDVPAWGLRVGDRIVIDPTAAAPVALARALDPACVLQLMDLEAAGVIGPLRPDAAMPVRVPRLRLL